MKIHLFGSCSGMEPIPGRCHTAWALETDGVVYWFDAGENCSRIAHLMGIDLLKIRRIILSHPHMDHVGGLANLIWNMKKLVTCGRDYEKGFHLGIHTPSLSQLESVLGILAEDGPGFQSPFRIEKCAVADGLLFEDGRVRVEALHNTHLGIPANGAWRSFSYRISVEGKTLVYSGDIGSVMDLDPFLKAPCDLLMVETGHHSPVSICGAILSRAYPVDDIFLLHHGYSVLRDGNTFLPEAERMWGKPLRPAHDAMTFDF